MISNIPVIYCDEGRTTTLLSKNMSFYSFEMGQIYVVYERQTETGTQRQISMLTHNFFFFSWSWHAVLFSRSHKALPLLDWGTQLGALNDCKLALTHTASNWPRPARSICIYHFVIPTTCIKPRDSFGLFTPGRPVQRNLSLTGRLRLSMPHSYLILTIIWFPVTISI